jgi:Chitobiase/beta-hexosaminidase C-terminal domain
MGSRRLRFYSYLTCAQFKVRFAAILGLGFVFLVANGCGNDALKANGGSGSSALSGNVHGGQQPISGATIQLYAVGSTGDGSASTPLVSTQVLTSSEGGFSLTGLYTCPTPSTNVYLTATGGNPGLQSGLTNANIAEMVALGPCGNLTPSTNVSVNELSTVAGVYALAPFMQSYLSIGAGAMDSQLLSDAFVTAGRMVDPANSAIPGSGIPAGQSVAATKLRALANSVSTCVNSAGGVAGDGSACGTLFSLTTPTSGLAPTDTVGALLNIANNPTNNVFQIFLLSPPSAPFTPALANSPTDWTLGLMSSTPSPTFSPAPGTYTSPTQVTLSDSVSGAQIYYTTDGSTPTTSSNAYTGSFLLSISGMTRAIAVSAGISSIPIAGIYTIQPPSISLTPPSVSLTVSQSTNFIATVSGLASSAVTWSLNPSAGSISTSGLYTAPATISAEQTIAVTATSVSDPLVSATATVTLVPPISVALTPSTVSLSPAQSQAFTATVSNSTNTDVTWSLSPAVGSITTTGVYSAPTSIANAQTVTVTATSVADSTKTASASVFLLPATTYYLSPTGSDSNSGTSSTAPWLTPNHSLNCGDVIIASAGTSYSAANFASGKWGTVTCSAGNNVAWLKCVTFDTCKISVTSGTLDGMKVSASYWGVQGWEVSNTAGGAGGGNCLTAIPPTSTTNIHHIVFANDVANICPLGGLSSGNNGTAGVDYFAVVGSIAYGAGQTNTWCGSGISVYEPVASDSMPGTHIYVGGNFSYGSTNPSGCYDGNGIIFDTFDGYQTPMPQTYTQQGVIDNNIALANGGVGVRIEYNNAGNGTNHSQIFARHNTMWGNSNGTYQSGNPTCGELQLYKTETTEAYLNLAATNQPGCYGTSWNPLYAYTVRNVDNTSSVYQNLAWSASGSYVDAISSLSFLFNPNNLLGSNPLFANAVAPTAPSCGGATSAPNCMATVIAHFTPTATVAVGYGYQTPSSSPVYDVLFPRWLCNINLPAGLVTMGCLTQ